ncbi:hypothetical protein IAU60_001701 [Kwoniella sp. DSM 27419]
MPNRYQPVINPYAPQSRVVPQPRRPSASAGGAGAARGPVAPSAPKVLLDDVDIEDFAPPEWRTVLNSRVDLGYPDFYPSRPGFDQPEDVLTEENVKNGFSGRNFVAVGAEVFSMHGPIHQHLSSGGLNLLQQLGKDVIEKRQALMPQISERTFRIPVRVTYNDTKRLQFLVDLANPQVPLHRLMKFPVPHGFKGIELLDSMFSPSSGPGTAAHNRNPAGGLKLPVEPIPLDRAIWFIRVLGANEISAYRGRTLPQAVATPSAVQAPSPAAAATPSSTTTIAAAPTLPVSSNDWYTQEFTNTLISWLRTQLAQLALPNTKGMSKTGVQPAKVPVGILSDDKAKAKWLSKWDYSTRLTRELHKRDLVSTRLLTGWLADFLGQANLAQLGFVAQLVGAYLPDMIKHLCNGRHCLRGACQQIKEIRESPAVASLAKVESMLVAIIQALHEGDKQVLISPTTWRLHRDILATILPADSASVTEARRRNEDLWFKTTVDERSSSPRRQQMADIQKLDSICEDTNMIELTRSFFDGASAASNNTPDMAKLEEKVFILLNWAMSLFQLGGHRPYAVYTILKHWHEQHEEHQAIQSRPRVIDLFPVLYKWLDTSSAALKEENIQAIGITYGELTRRGMWSYGRYLKTLIAKGQTARTYNGSTRPSRHLALLRAMPIFVDAKDLVQQRRVALCGDDLEARAEEEEEEQQIMEQFKEDVMEYIPEIFGYAQYKRSTELRDVIDYQIPSSLKMSRYLYVQVRFWLAPDAGNRLRARNGQPAMDASTFARVLQVFRVCKGHATIADFIVRALQDSEDEEILHVILDTVKRDADVWTSMDGWSRLGDKLLDRYHAIQTRGGGHPRTLELLGHLADLGRLSPEEEDEVRHLQGEVAEPTKQVIPAKLEFKESIHGLQQVLVHCRQEAAAALGTKLFARHGSFASWSTEWWTTIINILQHPTNQNSGQAIVDTAVSHINAVESETRGVVDPVIKLWLDGLTSSSLMDTFGKRASGTITQLLLELVIRRSLSTQTLLDKLLFPVWKHASSTALMPRKRLSSKQIQAVVCSVNIAAQLLVLPPLIESLPPQKPTDSLVALASRQEVFRGVNVQSLIKHLPLVVVLQKSNTLPDQTTDIASTMLRRLAMTAEFKTAAFRNLNVLKDAFLSSEWSRPPMDPALEVGMVDTLKLIMSEKPPNAATPASKPGIPHLDTNARFSAWRWTRIVLEMRVEFKGLASRIANGEDVAEARQTLNRLVHATLDRETTADDTDLLCEAFGGMDTVVTQEAIGTDTQDHLEALVKSIDQVLRILHSTYRQPAALVSDHALLGARHRLLDLLGVALQSIERRMSSEVDLLIHHELSPPQPGDLLKVVFSLLRFSLGVLTTDSSSPTTPKPNFPNLAVSFFKVILTAHDVLVDGLAESSADMLVYMIDCTPAQSRLACQTALLGETITPTAQSVLASCPALVTALPYLCPSKRNVAILGLEATDEHMIDSAIPLDERPWELFEQMAPAARPLRHQDLYLSHVPLKDTASIPIALFDPVMTRDALPGYALGWREGEGMAVDEEGPTLLPWEDMASERDLGDGFAGEPVFARQVATALYDAKQEYDLVEGNSWRRDKGVNGEVEETGPVSPDAHVQTRRMSTRIASHGVQETPKSQYGSGIGSNKDPIAIDEDSDDDEVDKDDEDEDDEVRAVAPAAKRPRTSSKSTASSSGRQMTGGKAPRKTTGGKSVSRKVTGGKGVRGGKAPKGSASGRRRSQAD